MSDTEQTPAEEAADWAAWLDRFERHILPVFTGRGYSRDTAALIYFTRLPDAPATGDEDEPKDPPWLEP